MLGDEIIMAIPVKPIRNLESYCKLCIGKSNCSDTCDDLAAENYCCGKENRKDRQEVVFILIKRLARKAAL